MNNEEAIKELREASDSEVRYGDTKHHYDEVIKRVAAFDMAIKALEQQPCEDCISRQEALSHKHIVYDDDGIGYSVVKVDEIMALSSVTPKADKEKEA